MKLTPKQYAKLRAQGKKRCPKCNKIKKLDEFNRNARHPTGRQVSCKACQRTRQRDPEWKAQYNERRRLKKEALAAQNNEG